MKEFDFAVWKEEKHFVALCLNVEVSSFGEDEKEALSNLKEAVELYFEDEDKEIPKIENLRIGKEKIDA
jgi:predicted RNase H-like HicB family nuclease